MITVQISTPNTHKRTKFEQSSFTQKVRSGINNVLAHKDDVNLDDEQPSLKPSKSSANLTAHEYEKYFTMGGKFDYTSKLQEILPVFDLTIVVLCLIWYCVSAVSSNISKAILKKFPHPTTLTEFQFLISSLFCIVTIYILQQNQHLAKIFPKGTLPKLPKTYGSTRSLSYTYSIMQPTKKIISTTLPMGMFQFVGHITSHKSTSLIPVSLVHSIKALSPLTTVLAYRFMFNVKYASVTYITLVPLMAGVILTCFSSKRGKSVESIWGFYKGLFYAFVSMAIFVSQNIFAKKILTVKEEEELPVNRKDEDEDKIDKITILLYCSLIGFVLTLPIYFISEMSNDTFTLFEVNFEILFLFLIHGLSHFCQAMIAFHLIGKISPVNYSIANILKRIVVISMAIFFEGASVNGTQGVGLLLTIFGLYAYDKWGVTKK